MAEPLITVDKNPAGTLPVLVTVPHAGVGMPESIRQAMLRTGEDPSGLARRLLDGADPFTDLIYAWPEARARVMTPVSRFVVDVNRSRDADGPNGVIKRHDFDFKPFYVSGHVFSKIECEERLHAFWDPFYVAVDACLRENDIQLLIDGHSMSAIGPTLGPDEGSPRPALCLGVTVERDGGPSPTCPPSVARAAAAAAEAEIARLFPDWPADRRVRLDDPFDGGHIARHFTQNDYDQAVPGIMLECNRGLYLNETTLAPKAEGMAKFTLITQAAAQAALVALATLK
jgi:N-formylglutamate deformylase